MKTSYLFLLALSGALAISCATGHEKKQIRESEVSDNIRINQVGYYPSLEKKFTVANNDAGSFTIVDDEGKIVFKGNLSDYGTWEPSGEKLKLGDFSEFNKEGNYFIHIPGVGNSYPFRISDKIYEDASIDALETFYFMRASMDMKEEYLGKFSRKAGHPDDTCYYHETTGHKEGFISSPGGWYDAGDYGKYIVNASISTGTMLLLYEMYPDVFADGTLNIPEKNNGKNDLLDELKYEFDWVLTMQDDDGGVFHKLTPLQHDGITMPHETHSKRYIFAKSTAASLDFAAMLAQASRLYRSYDTEFSGQCLKAAIRAYEWAIKNPDKYFSNPPGVNTGVYGDRELKEEFFWAAAELFCTTGDQKYYQAIKPELGNCTFRITESWRNYVDNLGYYSLYLSNLLDEKDRMLLKDGIIRLADEHLAIAQANPYGIPISQFEWGSNSDVLNTAVIQIMAHRITGDQKYLNAAAMFTDYIFGRNATGYSFVSGYGTKYSRNFHHRILWADDNDDPFPGFVAGGPNGYMQDKGNVESAGASYPDTHPAKAYLDHTSSYASNEICINWNAPLVMVLAYLNRQFAGEMNQ
jgi:endoglucanase